MKPSDTEIGKAYKAFSTYNHKAKKGRIETFDLPRWLRVIQALNGKAPTREARSAASPHSGIKSKRWTPEQRKKYQKTLNKRKREKQDAWVDANSLTKGAPR